MDIRKLLQTATSSVERLYDREATIKRYMEYEKPNGSTGMRWETVHENVPCRLSTVGSQTINNTSFEDVNTVQYDAKLILSTNYTVLAGDEITVYLLDDERNIVHTDEFEKAKSPFLYVTHQEVLINRKSYA